MYKTAMALLLALFVIISLWQLGEKKIDEARFLRHQTALQAFIPTPLTVAQTFAEDGDLIFGQLLYTLKRAGIGLFLGTVLGLTMAVIFLYVPALRNVVLPFSITMNSFPVVGFAPLIILTFGQGSDISIIFIATLVTYFPILINTDAGLRDVNQELLDFMKVLNASKWQEFMYLRFPLALPFLFTALRLAIPTSIIGTTMGEWLGTRNGIGQIITLALYQLRPGLLYASLLSVALSSLLFLALVYFVQSKFLVWRKE